MLEHLNPTAQKPSRVVVLGAYGFVGGTCARLLEARGVAVLALDKDDIDLMAPGAAEQLQTRLAPDDAILVVSARAPCKDTGMMIDNIRIMHAVCTALERSSVNHVVYFSSDAVYSDAPVPLTEESRTEPGSMHGTMHLARELMLKAIVKVSTAHSDSPPSQYLKASGRRLGGICNHRSNRKNASLLNVVPSHICARRRPRCVSYRLSKKASNTTACCGSHVSTARSILQ
jgi:nucleoside-diphosphate-sugar epimerase